MGQQWHYTRAGKQAGPVSAAELKQMASSGNLSPTDMVWKEGMPNWVPAEKLKGLFTATRAAPAPPSVPALDPAPFFATLPGPNTALPAPTPALFRFSCPACNFGYDVPHADSGKKFNCTKCGQRIQVPDPPQNKTVLGKLPGQEEIVETQGVNEAPMALKRQRQFDEHPPSASQPQSPWPYKDQPGSYPPPTTAGGTGMAVTGLVLGIVGFVFSFIPCIGWVFGILLGILGTIFSGLGLGQRQGKGMAATGLVLSILAIIWAPLFYFLILASIARAVK